MRQEMAATPARQSAGHSDFCIVEFSDARGELISARRYRGDEFFGCQPVHGIHAFVERWLRLNAAVDDVRLAAAIVRVVAGKE